MRVGGYRASQRVEGRADGMHPGSLSCVRLYSSLPCHVLVIPLLAALMVVSRRGGRLVTLVTLLTLMSLVILMLTAGRSRQQVFHHV